MSERLLLDVEGGRLGYRLERAAGVPAGTEPPLLVAIHGGGFTSAYFDCPGYSLLERASAAGCPAVAVDRPGYGPSTKLPAGADAIPRNADLLHAAIGGIWKRRDFGARGVVLIGHSIGSTTALYLAGRAQDWPLLGVAFSGLGLQPPTGIPPFWEGHDADAWVKTPGENRKRLMFGPPGSYREGAPELCDGVSESVWWREIQECYVPWRDVHPDVCARVRVPVHYRHGEHDPLWQNGPDLVDRVRAAFVNAPDVDAAAVPGAGHCLDFHLAGEALHDEQIAFAVRCAGGPVRGPETPRNSSP